MKKRCFALLLALSLLLTGCSPLFDLYSAFRGEYTRPDYSDGAISYRDFQRPYQPRVKYTAEPDIEYVRPDVDGLCSTLKSIGASATGGKAAAADIINQFDAAYDDYVLFNTMGELAYLRYTRDLSDSYYEAEYTWCTDQTTRVEKAMEDCYTTMAKSSLRSALEEQYFGEDFFASYDSDGVYSDARTVALLQQESELQAQYVALQNDPSIEWNGAVRSVTELLENAVTADLYYEVLGAYYDAYGAQAGEIYIKLIQTRRELAGRLGYGSYADYAYDALYYRDYTPAQAERYVERVRTELAPSTRRRPSRCSFPPFPPTRRCSTCMRRPTRSAARCRRPWASLMPTSFMTSRAPRIKCPARTQRTLSPTRCPTSISRPRGRWRIC